ncbi:DUF1801 domain-containing protein [Novosphingobium sp.]|uniref:DUF1801 domain-containing protein n=1 Tax=Novosphingobium sp. TaxID=1874826 RepID=UPI001EC3B975|nr:DUF1801 domain-containing protein [Novosphingobium sp.]MBK9010390.1 DUF1801 domain-containing protein [Novosphingobium sp.]
MAKAELKTTASAASPADFIAALPDERKRAEAAAIDELHRRVTGCEPKLWGPSIIGYGSYDYTYDSGRAGTWMRAGFSPRKAAMTIYLMADYCNRQAEADALFARLGKHKTGKSCLYINKLADVDLEVLEELVALSWQAMSEAYPD